jgi:hypothetical protein
MPRKNKKRAKRQQSKRKKVIKKAKKPRKPKSLRAQAKFPALEKKYNLPSRQELLDFDYLHKLNDKQKEWLNKFVSEEINADFRHSKPLNKTKKQRKACYDRNNSRNRDLLTKNKMIGNVEDIQTVKEISQLNPEEMLIGIQEKELLEKFDDLDNGFNSAEKSKNPTQKKH